MGYVADESIAGDWSNTDDVQNCWSQGQTHYQCQHEVCCVVGTEMKTYMLMSTRCRRDGIALLPPIAREEMIMDQYLTDLDSHELRVQVATTGVQWIEDLMRIT